MTTAIDTTQGPDLPPADRSLERRTSRRLPLVLPTRITFRSGPDQASQTSRTVPGRTRNLSGRGAYLTSSEAFEPGQVVFLALEVLALEVPPDRGRTLPVEIRCEAEVVRAEAATPDSGAQGVAVRFRRAGIPNESPSRRRPSARKIAHMAPL